MTTQSELHKQAVARKDRVFEALKAAGFEAERQFCGGVKASLTNRPVNKIEVQLALQQHITDVPTAHMSVTVCRGGVMVTW